MVKRLTEEGFYDDEEEASVRMDGEDFKLRDIDIDIGHPPARQSRVQGENPPIEYPQPKKSIFRKHSNPNALPPEEKKEAVKRWNDNPVVKDNDLVCVERNKMRIYLGAIIVFFILGGVAFYFLHDDISTFANKEFATTVTAEGDDINITNEYDISPVINNDHTILNNITIEMPDMVLDNSSDVVDSISNKVIEGIRPLIEEMISNVTNQTS